MSETTLTPTPTLQDSGPGDDVRHAFLVHRGRPLPAPGTLCKTVCGTTAPFPADAQIDKMPDNVCPLCAWVWDDSGFPR